ncbi:MAG: peptidoglycan-binding protein [Coriobacteriales bacterium]|jgi:peptidoglycan hydrolase-like protein with peptidoglycan-binding domain|nr:peptidoglycan-binding protein [Coriobacteriales bacterium]
MTELANITQGCKGSAVRDVQGRLRSLGYELGSEAEQSVFGEATARAVTAFRAYARLVPGDEVDRDTWTALVDATFTFGDRLLYLRVPYFHGCDVRSLQTALSALGFSCTADGIFGGHTERAVREFQQNAGIPSDGIVGDSTFAAIKRLRHAWEGKDQLESGTRPLGFARAAEVLESTPLCIWGEDSVACGVAERISNLAMATTMASLVVSTTSPEEVPAGPVLTIQLASAFAEAQEHAARGAEGPQVIYGGVDDDATINARMATAIGLVSGEQPRITVLLTGDTAEGGRLLPHEEQHAAIALLDALCLAFS